MPKLAAVVDSLDTLPEPIRELYTPAADGKFVLDADVEAHPALSGLRTKNAALIKSEKEAAARAKAFEGLDPEDVKAAIDARTKAEEEKKRREGDFDSWRKQREEQHAKDLKAKDDALAEATSTIEDVIGTDAARAAIVAEEGNAGLLLPHVRSQIKVVKDGKSWKRVVVDKSGNTRYNAKGDEMSVQELVAEMKGQDDFKAAFAAPNVNGSGAGRSAGTNTRGDVVISDADKANVGAYRRAMDEAKKRGVRVVTTSGEVVFGV